MANHNISRVPIIARNFVNAWQDHVFALENESLPYLDRLLDEMRLADPELGADLLKQRLYRMVPNLKLGTAGRLIDCKYELNEFSATC